jgi:dipeptidyl aminopeptidase/acylaminoacyl peptidase
MRRILTIAILLATSVAPAQQKRPITDRDLFDFHWIGDTQLSPSGSAICFVQTTVTPDHSGYQTELYLLDLTTPNATPVVLIPGTHDGSPRWSPDGRQIAFMRSADKPGAPPSPPQLYLTAAKPNASVIKLTELPKGASSPQWAPDGQALTVLSSTPQDQAKTRLEAAQKARATGDAAHVSDVRIVNRAIYRFNGEGNLDPTNVPQLYMVFLPKPDGTQDAPWQLTAGRYGVEDYLWSKSGWLFLTKSEVDEPIFEEFPHNTLYGLQPATGSSHPKDLPTAAFKQLMTQDLRGIALSPDGKHLAFHAAVEGKPMSHAETDLWVLDLDWTSGTPAITKPARNLTKFNGLEMGSGVGGDNTAPRGGGRSGLQWSADSNHLLDIAGTRGSALLYSIDTTSGDLTELTARKQAVLGFVATPDQKSIVALISNPILIGDLFRIDPAGTPASTAAPTPGNQTPITHLNDALFSQLDLRMPEDLKIVPTVHPKDIPFVKIDTFVQLPPDFPVEDKDDTVKPVHPYPAILNIHGGPHSAYGWVFDHEMLVMAARGYVVVYPNPRGSTTYGENFANIIMNNYPGDDFHDLMDTVDDVIQRGWADPDKLGVTGGSGGGLLTDWVVTHTNRFKAAVAQRDITDWANWWYTADAITFHQSFEPKAPPFDNVELYRAHSPITFVNNIKTPMMFILGDADYRTPPGAGGEDFFRALKYKHIPTVMVRFPRESHELSRSGEPWHRVERLDNIINWFDEFLMNKCEPQYDLQPTCTVQPKP